MLNLRGPKRRLRLGTFHGQDPTIPTHLAACTIESPTSDVQFDVPQVLVVPRLQVSSRYINWPKEKWRWRHLSDIDIPPYDSSTVGMFIGINVPGALAQLEKRTALDGPIGILSPFGWTVMGNVPSFVLNTGNELNNSCHAIEDDVLEQFWLSESFGSKQEQRVFLTQQDEEAMSTLRRTINYLGGRYEIGLPLKQGATGLPNNRTSALRRLYANESRKRVDPVYAARYTNAIEAYEKLGFARKLSFSELTGPEGRTWYVPHFLVENPNKPEKPRLVFDAASKHNGVCLNDFLLRGPVLLTNLHDLLITFREGTFGVSMDIEKMFLQVGVRKEDQALFRYLWRRPGSASPPWTYQMMVEIFGASSSPTSCTYVLRRTAEDNPEFSDVADKVTENFYVDNYLDSFDDAQEAARCCMRLTMLLQRGGFKLTHLMTSSPEIWKSFPPEQRAAPNLNVDLDGLPVERTLGLLWQGDHDTFGFEFKRRGPISTKCQILSAVSSVFDPLGFLSCVTLTPKLILQDIWRVGKDSGIPRIGWDDMLPPELQERWESYSKYLDTLETLHIPRNLRPTHFLVTNTTFQLHTFCDASQQGYSAVVYLRAQFNNEISTSFVTARAKVAPVRQLTIPRLELMAAVMGYRLGRRINNILRVKNVSATWWTDSTAVLHWLRTQATTYSQFVACRKEEILEGSSSLQ